MVLKVSMVSIMATNKTRRLCGSSSADLSDLFSSGQRAWPLSSQITLALAWIGKPNRRRTSMRECVHPGISAALMGALLMGAAGNASAQSGEQQAVVYRQVAWFAQLGLTRDTQTLTVGGAREWNWTTSLGDGLLTGQTEISLGRWHTDLNGRSRSVTQIGLTPSLRYYFSGQRSGWFLEGGIGVNYLTPKYQRDDKRFSTRWNFGDHVALGRRFGSAAQHEVAFRVQHYSNASVRKPNPGENFLQLRYAWYF